MASEPTEEGPVPVDLPPELDEWLRGRATELGVEPGVVLVQLVSSYRAAAELEGRDGAGLALDVTGAEALEGVLEPAVEDAVADAMADSAGPGEDVEATVRTVVEDELRSVVSEEVERALDERAPEESAADVEAQVEAALDERLSAALQSLESDVDERLGEARSEFREKLDDVRSRVIQVKQEADEKAPADHDHEELARVDAIGGRLADLEEDVESLEATLETVQETLEDRDADEADRIDELAADFDDLDERLTTVAWVVSDLREAYESGTGTAALEELKREAAAADVSRANCENCGEGVEIGLLTEPACPHCETTVTTLDPRSGFFKKPRLLVASQLESGEQ